MRLPVPVFYPCRGRGALPRASGDWREKIPRCTRGTSLEEQKVQQEHKKISWFRSSGSSQARAQVKKKRSGARQEGPPAEPHSQPISLMAKKGSRHKKNTCKTKEVHGKGTAAAPKPSLVLKQRSASLETNYQGPPSKPPTQPPPSLCLEKEQV